MAKKSLAQRALENEEVRAEYDALTPEFKLLEAMLVARKKSGLSQSEVAVKMGTKRPSITRLEKSLVTGSSSPSIATLKKYADAVGRKLDIRLV